MAEYEELKGFRRWAADRLKLNPAQPSIASLEPYASPETIVDYEQAYRDIEVIHRSVEMIINACIEIPLIVEGGSPAKKVNKILNIRPNPFEDRVRLFRRAFLDFILDGNAFSIMTEMTSICFQLMMLKLFLMRELSYLTTITW